MINALGQVLPRAAKQYGTKTALITERRSLTFIEMEHLSNRMANALTALGVERGDRVTLYGPNAWEWIVAYYAILKAGGVVNPVNSMLTAEELTYVINDAGSKVLIASDDKPFVMEIDCPSVEHRILWGEDAPLGALYFDELLDSGTHAFRPLDVAGDDLGCICYTSGTTGRPKGALQSQRSLLLNPAYTAMLQGRNRNDVFVNPLPCPHVYASVLFNANFLCGSTLVLLERFSEHGMLNAIQEYRGTVMDIVPTGYYYLLAHPDLEKYDLSSLNRCTVGGQTLPAAKSLEFTERTGVPVLEMWGMTELTGGGAANPALGINKPGTIGPVYPGMSARVVDAEDPDRDLPDGEAGELMLRGPLVMQGYYNNPEATAETIRPDGWMHTGDIVTRDADGYLTIVDRKKDMILTAGFNIYPVELERTLCKHPAVAMAAVGGVPDETKGEIAKAYVVVRPGAKVSARDLANECRKHLAAYKTPRAIQFVDEVPITPTGKVMRRLLKDIDDGTRSLDGCS
ncbi:AMP-binding protein [Mameliella alba]|nr:AMP-binding protein [Mameliella alba]MBY6168042.1 AMP-binding protein [Mameliella alba]MBY6173063.1 AMP-binding protein [Mameliella alba]